MRSISSPAPSATLFFLRRHCPNQVCFAGAPWKAPSRVGLASYLADSRPKVGSLPIAYRALRRPYGSGSPQPPARHGIVFPIISSRKEIPVPAYLADRDLQRFYYSPVSTSRHNTATHSPRFRARRKCVGALLSLATSSLDSSMSLFAPLPRSDKRFARQHCVRTSTKVSPGFLRPRKSSLSFGSQRMCFASDPYDNHPDRALLHCLTNSQVLTFIARRMVSITKTLAHSVDSLVRVSRRLVKDRVHMPA